MTTCSEFNEAISIEIFNIFLNEQYAIFGRKLLKQINKPTGKQIMCKKEKLNIHMNDKCNKNWILNGNCFGCKII